MKYYLVAHTPLAAEAKGFPREGGKPYFPGQLLRESIEEALFFYALGKHPDFAELVRVFLMAGNFDKIASVKDFLLERLRERYLELQELVLPEKIWLEEITSRLVHTIEVSTGRILKKREHQVFIGVAEFEAEIPQVMKYAGLSYCEGLARAELRHLRETMSKLVPFYEDLTNRLRNFQIPLRTGYWTDDPFGGLLLAYWRVKEVREVIKRRLKRDPLPETVLYSPKDKATFGWIEITENV
ncbi:hypothetical protein Thein_0801 [Thermodesulfatator indicus DSM 15286]|uniref:Uncharacterized protein n=1 Tax=Thermodesulfatator indicus (strain DSM 15286 / JCM 11887 / CIR29812) TaxID=667014 RepID=F8A8A6_THEID|nr:hypothetical protein [Thermodesulfatator indicus]AEH44679.1 hypothetical protein Thein_0801 [Thermodesulfatator indicus DSM 15286]